MPPARAIKGGLKSMSAHDDSGINSRIYYLVPVAILLFGFFRVINAYFEMGLWQALISGIYVMGAFALILLNRRFNHFISPAFFEPLLLYLLFAAGSAIIRNFDFFFMVSLTVCCVGATYLNPRRLLEFVLVSNLITLVLILNDIPMINSTRVVMRSEIMVDWILQLMSSLFVYLVTKIAVDKMNQAKMAEDSFDTLLDVSPDRIALLDSLNRVTYLSRSFVDMVDMIDPKLIMGRPLLDLFNDIDIKDVFIDILKEENQFEGIREIILDGEHYYFRIISKKLPQNRGKLISFIDITPELTAKLEAEAVSKSKSAFLATMSHEIRTPLNAVIGFSEIEMQKKHAGETLANLEKIFNSGSSLLGIINQILDISKIETGNFELITASYDVPSLINDTVHLNMVRIGSKEIVFNLTIDEMIPVKLSGDEMRVKQILNNLLSNAFKYTKAGAVKLKINFERQDNDIWLIFEIMDTGQGIRDEDIQKLFSEYTQLDTRANRNIEGTGLGLAITKKLVDMMDGTIQVESNFGKGSVFTVRIRQGIVDESPLGRETAENLTRFRLMDDRRARGKNLLRTYMPYGKVLLVDDVITNLDVARGLMLPYGLQIDSASSGREAIDKVYKAAVSPDAPQYDVVFMDHMMPELDGVETVRIIRSEINSEYARTVPIIALTANALVGNEEMFLANGFNGYISKPIDIMQLDVALNTWVRNKQSEETLKKVETEKAVAIEEVPDSGILEKIKIPGIDLSRGKERYNGESIYINIIRSYYIHTPSLLEKLRTVSEETLPAYAVTVHGLKGSSYGICADEVGALAEALEMASKTGDVKTVKEKNGQFLEKAEKLLSGLGKLMEEIDKNKEAKQKAQAPDQKLLEEFLDACIRFKSSRMEEILGELEKYEYESEPELIPWLREQLDNLEYDTIRERLEGRAS
jgi:signal transduction histidine kinase/DNA-binding NarL/FixJ family response regulator